MPDRVSCIVSKNDPQVCLYTIPYAKGLMYAIDTYVPNLTDDMTVQDRIFAYESALGYRLNGPIDGHEDVYYKPRAIDPHGIREIITAHLSDIKASPYPLMVGHLYDGLQLIDGSTKHVADLIPFLGENVPRTIISTAYTPTDVIRKSIRDWEGRFAFEFRIPSAFYGVRAPKISQVAYTAFRCHLYGGNARFYLRFGPINDYTFGKLAVSRFWTKATNSEGTNSERVLDTSPLSGIRLFFPTPELVPAEYLSLLEQQMGNKHLYAKKSGADFTGHFTKIDSQLVMLAALDAMATGMVPEVYGYEGRLPANFNRSAFGTNGFNRCQPAATLPTARDFHDAMDDTMGNQLSNIDAMTAGVQ